MSLSLLEQVVAAKRLTPQNKASKEKRAEKLHEIVEFLLDKNATTKQIAEHLGVIPQTAQGYLKDLQQQRRIVSWHVDSTPWHTASDKERARLKH